MVVPLSRDLHSAAPGTPPGPDAACRSGDQVESGFDQPSVLPAPHRGRCGTHQGIPDRPDGRTVELGTPPRPTGPELYGPHPALPQVTVAVEQPSGPCLQRPPEGQRVFDGRGRALTQVRRHGVGGIPQQHHVVATPGGPVEFHQVVMVLGKCLEAIQRLAGLTGEPGEPPPETVDVARSRGAHRPTGASAASQK